MNPLRKRAANHTDPTEQQMRDQEVLRANKELAAYFKGRRTEREARAAMKIIKAFIRDRERGDPATRRPLPGTVAPKPIGKLLRQNTTTGRNKPPGGMRRSAADTAVKGAASLDASHTNLKATPTTDEGR